MGGPGNGNVYHWWRPAKKTPVEDCRDLDVNVWSREGVLQAGVARSGGLTWTNARTGEEVASIGYHVDTTDMGAPVVRLSYTINPTGERVGYAVRLQTTRVHRGGQRWWFTCPLVMNGRPCGRRVGKLYLPPGGRYFGCRHCYDLTYRCCQDSRKYDGCFAGWRRTPGWTPAT
jgi:hypothetical protein